MRSRACVQRREDREQGVRSAEAARPGDDAATVWHPAEDGTVVNLPEGGQPGDAQGVENSARGLTAGEHQVDGPAQSRQRPAHEVARSEEHTSELQSRQYIVCRLLL